MTPALRETFSTSLTLLVFSVACAGLLAAAFFATRPNIEQSEQAEKMRLVAQALPPGSFDNDPIHDALVLAPDPLLGMKRTGLAYVAAQGSTPVAVALEAIAPDGYAGQIKLLIGIQADGRIAGVRVTAHQETPGLGDYIDAAKSHWIEQFKGKSLTEPDAAGWKVHKDGGQFDYLAGATISPRAVVKAVHKALTYFDQHREALLQVPQAEHGPQGEQQTGAPQKAAQEGTP